MTEPHPERMPDDLVYLLRELCDAERDMGAHYEDATERLRRLAPVIVNGGWFETPELEDAREAYMVLRQFAPSAVWLLLPRDESDSD